MCGVFYIDDDTMREIEKIARKIDQKKATAGDVHPSQPALTLRINHGEIVSEVLKWGYEAYGKKTTIFNARSETVRERPMFRRDFEERRCLIPAVKFYEWRQTDTKKKEKYEFFAPDKILYLAGIYHKDPEGDRFTILTRAAEGCMMGIHHRMPLILNKKDMEKWLFSQAEAVKLLENHYIELEKGREEVYRQMDLSSFCE
ncbi:MAG: SOS response-associated peptidase [Lachnospiraceae bacterium]|nr:SOS response-associated peptidase [Lachnospiraceae bacterium]